MENKTIFCPKCKTDEAISLQEFKTKTGNLFYVWKCKTKGCGMSVPAMFFSCEIDGDDVESLLNDYKDNFKVSDDKRQGAITVNDVHFPSGKTASALNIFLSKEVKIINSKEYPKYILKFEENSNENINSDM